MVAGGLLYLLAGPRTKDGLKNAFPNRSIALSNCI